jgi:HlyD family secretion protein
MATKTMSMDVARAGYAQSRRRRRWYIGGGALIGLIILTWLFSLLEPAPPSVDRDTVYFGTVERGRMLRQVRGHGSLAAVEMRWVPARTSGRVERIVLQPGAAVEPDSVILQLTDPEVERAALDAEKALVRARAELASLEVLLGSQELDLQAQAAAVESEYIEAKLWAEAEQELAKDGLMSDIQCRITEARAAALKTRHEIAMQRVGLASKSHAAQLEAKRAEVEQHRAMAELRSGQRDALFVRAGLAGVIQQLPVEVGQQVAPGANLALVAEPTSLQAEVRVPATQAQELRIGQVAHVDTRNGIVDGRVARIDPTVRQGTVQVDIELPGELPPGARPDLSVEGRIDIELLEDVLFVDRPASATAHNRVELFLVEPDGEHANRVEVRLGRASVSVIEVIEGLAEADRIVVSDTRRWDEHDRLRFK